MLGYFFMSCDLEKYSKYEHTFVFFFFCVCVFETGETSSRRTAPHPAPLVKSNHMISKFDYLGSDLSSDVKTHILLPLNPPCRAIWRNREIK